MRAAGVWGPKDKDEEDKKASPPINLTTEHIIIVIMKYREADAKPGLAGGGEALMVP